MAICTSDKKRSVLLVENKNTAAMPLEKIITGFGCDVTVADSGEEAVRLASGNAEIDLILMDIDQGVGIDGPYAAQRILARRSVPIVFLASHPEKEHIERIKKISRYGYLMKDSEETVLRSAIETALEMFAAHENLRIQHDLCYALNSTTELQKGLKISANALLRVNGVDSCCIYMANSADGSLDLKAHRGLQPEFAALVSHLLSGSMITQSAMTAESFYGQYAELLPTGDDIIAGEGLRAIGIIPVTDDERLVAVINPASHVNDSFPDGTRFMLETLSSRIGDALIRLRKDAALVESEKKYRRITENMSDIVSEMDANGIHRYISPSHRKVFGENPEELIGRSVMEGVHPEDLDHVSAAYSESIRMKIDREVEYRYRHGNGKYIWIRTAGHPIYNESGKLTGAILTSSDITERKRIEEALRDSENRYRQLFTHAPAGIWEVDFINRRFTKVNSLICEYTGFSESELLTMNPLDILTEESRQRLITRTAAMMTGQQVPENVEYCIKEKNGGTRWVELNNQFIRDDGKIVGATVVAHDISERKRAAEKIQNLLTEKELLIKEVHHRIKNNMNTMMSLLSLQADAVKEPSAVAALEDASNRMRSMGVLYNKLYQSDGLREMSIRDYLPALIDEIVSIFPNNDTVSIHKHIDDFVLGVKVLTPLGIIVNELVTNAMKYAFIGKDDGMISVTASVIRNRVLLIIEDNGVGIPGSIDVGTSRGFGLTLVGMLAEQLRGTITITRGKGTRFELEFEAKK